MSRRPFAKPALSFTEQVTVLQGRGMIVDDPARAEFYLRHLNYYRLGAYWLPFEADHASHTFRAGTRFEDVLNLYVFDRELRLLLMDALERIEVSARTQWAHQLARCHGSHAHLESGIAFHSDRHRLHLQQLTEVVDRSEETFIRHLMNTYQEALPPVWAVCEVMSLGQLSHWYSNLKPMPTRRRIAAPFGVDEGVLQSWLHHLTVVRNTCAHHARLWNRELTVLPQVPRSKPTALKGQFQQGSRRLYNTLLILQYMMDVVAPASQWRQRLLALIEEHEIDTAAMGFPADWQSRPIWITTAQTGADA
jgi:abortive infection bacteriophage resistance protein